jgi:glycerate dehydrogenase
MGIVGLGRIGRAVSDLAQAFGMKVIAAISPRAKEIPHNVSIVDLDYLFRSSDVVSLHCPLTNDTRHLVDATRLSRMKPTAFLINTSRGPLVDEEALAGALKEGRIAGAGLDVLSSEPPAAGNPLLSAKNCIVTPHVAWATRAARARLLQATVENAQAFLAGKPRNVVGG